MRIAKSEQHNLWINIGVTDATGKGGALFFPLLVEISSRGTLVGTLVGPSMKFPENLPRSGINYQRLFSKRKRVWNSEFEKNTGG